MRKRSFLLYRTLACALAIGIGCTSLERSWAQDTPAEKPADPPAATPEPPKPAEPAPAPAAETPPAEPAKPAEPPKPAEPAAAPATQPPAETKPEPKPEPKDAPKSPETAAVDPAAAKGEQKADTPKPAAEPKPAVEVDDRLEKIEKQLGDISKLLQSMKPAASGSSKETNASSSETKPTEPKSTQSKATAWDGEISKDWLKGIRWRSIGPANMGGRIVDLAVNENDPNTFWAATASGGLIKTTNSGVSFTHQFDREATVSIGAVAVSKSNPDIVWVGTGENNPRNSVSYGDGVYKSIDGGKTWTNMGLKKTFQVGEIVIHPTDPNTVYVGALGRLYGNNEERGVYKTTDGGATWERCFYLDERTGIIEMQMHPTDPNTLIATAWERLRDGFDSWPGTDIPIPEGYGGYDPIRKWGPGSGLYKTTDGGKSWKKLTKGLPTSQMGRIGIDWFRKDPNVIFAVVDCENIGKGPAPLPVLWGAVGENRDGKAVITQVYPRSPAARAGLLPGDIIETMGEKAITDFDTILDELRMKKAGDKFSTNILRGADKKILEFTLVGRGGSGGAAQRTGPFFGAFGEDDEAGLKVVQMLPESSASKSGLLADDVIVEFDGAKAESWESLTEAVSAKNVGDKVKVKLIRSSESKELEVTLEGRPTGFGGGGGGGAGQPPQGNTYIGITGQNATATGGGAKLTEITAGGPAEKAGILKGDVLQAVDDKPVADYRAALDAIREKKAGEKVKLKIARATEVKDIDVTVENRPGPVRPYTASLGGQAQNIQDQQGAKGYEYGGIYKSIDGGESWTRINSVHSRPMYFSVVRVDPSDDQKIYLLGVSQFKSLDGGVTFDANLGRNVHADGHSLWIDPRDGRHMIIGVDGGVYTTNDRGNRWDHLNTLAMGQFYHVAIAPKYPYYVYGGLQDNGTWGGPAISLNGSGPVNEDWLSVGGGDGFMCRVDPNDPDLVYWTSQDGNMGRRNMKTGERASIRPQQNEGEQPFRFNWSTPFILSNFNSRVFYAGGNYVFRSWDRGSNLEKISPEITLTKRGSATALSESPRSANVLYAGTDDGALWVTRDGGKEWTEIGKNLNLPAPRWVSTIEASRYADGRVYVCLDGHRSNDDDPYVFVSEDFGKTWKSIRTNLPWGSTRCLRESPFNENLLVVGTEFAVYASANRGETWNTLNTNLPTVPVFDFAFHPNNGEIVAATHGRSLWVADITPLHQLAASHLKDAPYLYKSPTAIKWKREASRGGTNRRFVGENPPAGAVIYYALPKKAEQVSVKIIDATGQTIRELRGGNEAGLQRVIWDLVATGAPAGGRGGPAAGGGGAAASPPASGAAAGASAPTPGDAEGGGGGRRRGPRGGGTETPETPAATPATPAATPPAATTAAAPAPAEGQAAPAARRGGGGGGGFGRGRTAASGSYRVVLTVDGKEFSQELRVISDPNLPIQSDLTGVTQEYDVWLGDDVEFDNEEEEESDAPNRNSGGGGEG